MLTDRQKQIMKIIIDDYVSTAEPVGSRTISKRDDVSFSAATIRNEMSDLEELGFLIQPHTSAGRIPSQKGYRFYVDHVIKPRRLSKSMMQTIRHSYARQYMEFEKVIQQTAMILSGLTSYTSIAMGTDMLDATLKHIQLLPLSERSAVAILVTNTGHVENRKIAVPEQISVYEMEQLVNLLNDKLSGVSMIQLSQRLYTEMAAEMQKHMRNYENLLNVVEQVLEGGQEDMVFLEGAAHIFAQPEFRDVEKVKSLFELLDKEERIQDILSVTKVEDGIQVRIGHENSEEAMADCSIITAAYSLNGRPAGSLSILGPTRMDYQKVISIMDYVTRDLSSWLDKMYRSE